MALYTPIIGDSAEVGWIPEGGGAEVKLRNEKWSMSLNKDLKDAPNTTDGMVRIPSKRDDATGSVEGPWNDETPITSIVREGDIGTLKLYTRTGKFFSMSAVIGTIDVETEYDDPLTWSLNFSLYGGSVTRPDANL